MALDFNQLLTTEQKSVILANSLQQLAAQGYTLSLNKKTVEELGGDDAQDKLSAIDSDINTIETAISVYQAELESLQSN